MNTMGEPGILLSITQNLSIYGYTGYTQEREKEKERERQRVVYHTRKML